MRDDFLQVVLFKATWEVHFWANQMQTSDTHN